MGEKRVRKEAKRFLVVEIVRWSDFEPFNPKLKIEILE